MIRQGVKGFHHPGGNPGANLKSISHKCYLFEVAFVWELTEETIVLPLGCLQGGDDPFCSSLLHLEPYTLHAGPHTPLPTR